MHYQVIYWVINCLNCILITVLISVVISRPWSRDSMHSSSFCLGLETWWPRSRSWSRDLKALVSDLVSRPEDQSWSQDSMLGAYAFSTIIVICSTFKRVLCHQLELMRPVLWYRDHGLETRVHSSSFFPGLGLEIWSPKSRSWSRNLRKGLDNNTGFIAMDKVTNYK